MSDDITPQSGAETGTQEFDTSGLPDFGKLAENAENATVEEVIAAAKAAQTLLGKAKHFYEKANRPPKVETPTPQTPARAEVDDDIRKDIEGLKLSEQKRQFGYRYQYDPEETDQLFAFAKGMGITPEKAMEHPFFKGGLEASREQRRASGAIPGPSSRSPVIEGKPVNKLSGQEIGKDYAKVAEAVIKARKR